MKSFKSTFHIPVFFDDPDRGGICNLIHFKIEKVNARSFGFMSNRDRVAMKQYIQECREKLDLFERELAISQELKNRISI